MKNDNRSNFSNLNNWKEEAWKNQSFKASRCAMVNATIVCHFFKVCKNLWFEWEICWAIRFEREYSCNEGNLTWKIINRELSEPSGLAGLISDTANCTTSVDHFWLHGSTEWEGVSALEVVANSWLDGRSQNSVGGEKDRTLSRWGVLSFAARSEQ